MDFDTIKSAFVKYFKARGYTENDFCNLDGSHGRWVFAICSREKNEPSKETWRNVHYELIAHGEEFFVELHFELYKNQLCEYRAAIQRTMREPNNRRLYVYEPYYSTDKWRCRNPITRETEVTKDLDILCALIDNIISNNKSCKDSISVVDDQDLSLPCSRTPKQIDAMIQQGVLSIPAIQRGKVWNAARTATLWDSLMRKIPLGAFSVRRANIEDRPVLELMDGQQRSTAISLGYASFIPVKGSERNSVLWIDLGVKNLKNECKFSFYVTTASQPWGYASSEDETKNALLGMGKRREALDSIREWHDKKEKPYPFEAYPYEGAYPVPFTLLREYLDSAEEPNCVKFIEWCKRNLPVESYACNWINALEGKSFSEDVFKGVVKNVYQLNDNTILLYDSTGVVEKDIALYFARIGRGGVVPSEEELAFSVLKSKLGPQFKEVIDRVWSKNGLANPSRIASIAIRYFKSTEMDAESFASSEIMSIALEICKDTEKKGDFERFIKEKFENIVAGLEKELFVIEVESAMNNPNKLTHWHETRYCQEFNGDIFLFLLIAFNKKPDMFRGISLGGLAEVLYGYAVNPGYVIRRILKEGPILGLLSAESETYYGVKRLERPIAPRDLEVVLRCDDLGALREWMKDPSNEAARWIIAEGYHNSRKNRAYNKLLFACKASDGNDCFRYDPCQNVWSEDNCPWDYDHMLPHSWIDKMPKKAEDKDICDWLVNSVGNLCPLPFSINRSISDSQRSEKYPFEVSCSDNYEDKQKEYHVNGKMVSKMWTSDHKIDKKAFAIMTISRFCEIYRFWYDNLGIQNLFNGSNVLGLKEEEIANMPTAVKYVVERYWTLVRLKDSLPGEWTLRYQNGSMEVQVDDEVQDVCVKDWLSLCREFGPVAVSIWRQRDVCKWYVGISKKCNEEQTKLEIAEVVKKAVDKGALGLKCEVDKWWYAHTEFDQKAFLNEGLSVIRNMVEIVNRVFETENSNV